MKVDFFYNMITKPHLYITLCAAIAVGTAFTSCSKDDDITTDDTPKAEIVVISPADSIITAPFVTITNKYDLSSIKKAGNDIFYSTTWSPLKGGFVESVNNKKLNDGETSISSSYNYLQNDTQYRYVTILTSGDEQVLNKTKIYMVKFDEKNFAITNNAVQGSEQTTLKVSCKFNIPKEFRDKYDCYICYSTDSNMLNNRMKTASGEVKCELDEAGNSTVELKNLRLNQKYYYQAMIQQSGYALDTTSVVSLPFDGLCSGEIKTASTPDLDVKFTIEKLPEIDFKGFTIPVSATTSNGDNDRMLVGVCYSATNKQPTVKDDTTSVIANLSTNTMYYYRPYVKYRYDEYEAKDSTARTYCVVYGDVKTFKTPDLSLAKGEVDLGLSVKWSGKNVGASNPEDNGYYFTQKGEGYDAKGKEVAELTIPDGWRLPTDEEWEELEKAGSAYICHKEQWGNLVEINGKQLFIPDNSLDDEEGTGNYWTADFNGIGKSNSEGLSHSSAKGSVKHGVRLVKDKAK